MNELTQEVRTGTNPYSESFTYDAMGNRESETLNGNLITYGYDSDDELLFAGNNSYTYDADGDRISATVNGVTTGFGYDYDNQLVSITTGSNVVGYAYDALGRRVSRTAGMRGLCRWGRDTTTQPQEASLQEIKILINLPIYIAIMIQLIRLIQAGTIHYWKCKWHMKRNSLVYGDMEIHSSLLDYLESQLELAQL